MDKSTALNTSVRKEKKKKEPKNKVMISNHFYHLDNDDTKLSDPRHTVADMRALLFFFPIVSHDTPKKPKTQRSSV